MKFELFMEISFDDISKTRAVLSCFLFSTLYVGSLYIKSQQLPRDHPKTIKERITRVTIASLIACYMVYLSSSAPKSGLGGTFLQWIGIRLDGIIFAVILSALLILILFLGPVVMFLLDHGFSCFTFYHPSDIILWRNYFVAPLSEELVFRGCMMPLLVPAFGQTVSILLAPWFFGLAHIHHAYEQYKGGYNTLPTILISTLFQASYTTLFGILSSYIFLRTGHLISAFVSHSLCNMMGFPEFDHALHHPNKKFVCTCFVVGLIAFLLLLKPLTEPYLFSNNLYAEM